MFVDGKKKSKIGRNFVVICAELKGECLPDTTYLRAF